MLIKEIQEALQMGDAEVVRNKTEEALGQGFTAEEILEKGLIPTITKIGKEFRAGDIFIPDVLMSSRAMHACLYVLKPLLSDHSHGESETKGTIIIGTVAGDLHDIGKKIIAMCLSGDSYNVIDLGIDVPATDFVDAIRKYKPDIVAISALLTTTIEEMRDVITTIVNEGLRKKVKIIVGGGPVTPDFAESVGADAYGEDVFDTIEKVNALLGQKPGMVIKH